MFSPVNRSAVYSNLLNIRVKSIFSMSTFLCLPTFDFILPTSRNLSSFFFPSTFGLSTFFWSHVESQPTFCTHSLPNSEPYGKLLSH